MFTPAAQHMRKGDASVMEDLLNAGCSYLYLQFDTKLSLYHNISFRTAQKSYCISITKTSRVIQLRDMIPAVRKQMKCCFTYTSRLKCSALSLMEAIPLCDMIQIYTSIYVNTQLYLLLMQLYFAVGDMFRLRKQPSSGQITME